MNAGRLIILRVVSLIEGCDAQNERDEAAAQQQQQLRCSSCCCTAARTTTHVASIAIGHLIVAFLFQILLLRIASLLEVLLMRSSWQHLEEGRELLLRSLSSVAAEAVQLRRSSTAGDGCGPTTMSSRLKTPTLNITNIRKKCNKRVEKKNIIMWVITQHRSLTPPHIFF
tara:strand:+ start:82 stop:591 length:510 start_codon:yes stop_codon:yes gene_type:complete